MRLILNVLVFLSCIQSRVTFAQVESSESGAGCSYGVVSSNGIFFNNGGSLANYSVDISTIDSVDFTLTSGCSSVSVLKLTRNNENVVFRVIDQRFGKQKIRALGLPGKYHFTLYLIGLVFTPEFEFVLPTVGIKESPVVDASINIYPNPTRNIIKIVSKEAPLEKISIKNNLGQEVRILDAQSNYLEVPVDDLQAGIYFIYVATDNDKLSTHKIIVE